MLVHANQKTWEGRKMQDVHLINISDQSLQLCTSQETGRSGEGGLMILPCHFGHGMLIILSRVDETASKLYDFRNVERLAVIPHCHSPTGIMV